MAKERVEETWLRTYVTVHFDRVGHKLLESIHDVLDIHPPTNFRRFDQGR